MNQPIPVRVTRYACPHCPRTHSSRRRAVEHMGRCWRNPATKGCKTCEHFDRNYDDYGDGCLIGVDLTGRPECADCKGSGFADDVWDSGKKCPTCNGQPAEVKPGPITGCPKWAPSSLLTERS